MITLSFADFLNTGRLGPVAPDMNLDEVAEVLGPPSWWNIEDAYPAPHYWGYGHYLEIAFRFDGRPRCSWFQLEAAGGLAGDAVLISDDFVMALDGLTGKSSISRYISAIGDIDRVKVSLFDVTGSRYPAILIDNVEIGFNCDGHIYEAATPLDEAIAIIEAHSSLDSIYSYAKDENLAHRHQQFRSVPGSVILSGQDYLDLAPASQAAGSAPIP